MRVYTTWEQHRLYNTIPACMHLTVQIPKLLALASVALRVQWRECDEHLEQCSTDFMAVGGVLHLDILSLPVPSNKVNGWTLRPVTHDSLDIHRSARQQQGVGRQCCSNGLSVFCMWKQSSSAQVPSTSRISCKSALGVDIAMQQCDWSAISSCL